MSVKALVLAVPLAGPCLTAACTTDRGDLAAASTRALPIPMQVIARDVTGRSCGVSGPRFTDAVRDALRRTPPANALVNAWYNVDDVACIEVHGTAVLIEARPGGGTSTPGGPGGSHRVAGASRSGGPPAPLQ